MERDGGAATCGRGVEEGRRGRENMGQGVLIYEDEEKKSRDVGRGGVGIISRTRSQLPCLAWYFPSLEDRQETGSRRGKQARRRSGKEPGVGEQGRSGPSSNQQAVCRAGERTGRGCLSLPYMQLAYERLWLLADIRLP